MTDLYSENKVVCNGCLTPVEHDDCDVITGLCVDCHSEVPKAFLAFNGYFEGFVIKAKNESEVRRLPIGFHKVISLDEYFEYSGDVIPKALVLTTDGEVVHSLHEGDNYEDEGFRAENGLDDEDLIKVDIIAKMEVC